MCTPSAAPSTPVQLVASVRLLALGVVLWFAFLPDAGAGLVGLVLGVVGLVGSQVAPMIVEQPPVLARVRGCGPTALVAREVVARRRHLAHPVAAGVAPGLEL